MGTGNLVLTYVETLIWPITVSVCAVVSLYIVSRVRDASKVTAIAQSRSVSRLDSVLDDIGSITTLGRQHAVHPLVRLHESTRYRPTQLQDALIQVAERFRGGSSLIIDLTALSVEDSVRMIDFCGGMAYVSQGWVERLSEKTIVVIPRRFVDVAE